MGPQATRRPGEIAFSVLMLAVSVFLFWSAYQISGLSAKSSPGAFPLAATGAMVLASIVSLIKTLRTPAGNGGFAAFRQQITPNVVILFSLLSLFYGLALESLGFVLTSFTFLFAGILLLYRRGVGAALFYALVSVVIVYIVFRLVFQVVLPEGIIPERRLLADVGVLIKGVFGK